MLRCILKKQNFQGCEQPNCEDSINPICKQENIELRNKTGTAFGAAPVLFLAEASAYGYILFLVIVRFFGSVRGTLSGG